MRRGRRGAGAHPHVYALLALAALAAVRVAAAPLAGADLPVKVIAHPSRAGGVAVSDARAIYLKQKQYWSDGQAIVPINRESGSAARERFSAGVFGKDSRRMAEYWNRRYFDAGEFPPATLASDDAVIRFVARTPNAIGYVLSKDPGDSVAVVLEIE